MAKNRTQQATNTPYSNAVSGLTATDVKSAIDEIQANQFDPATIVTHNLNALGGELLDYDLGSASYVSAGYRVVVDNNGKVVTI